MIPANVRNEFLRFCGPRQFRKFARSLVKLSEHPPTFDRLRYWQDSLWCKFHARFPDSPVAVNDIGTCLHWCHLHDTALIAGAGHQPVDLRRSQSFALACDEGFPHGYGWLVYHCSSCRASCIDWIARHPDECRMLRGRVHDAEWVAMHRHDLDFLSVCRDACIPVTEIRDGDEIWTINTGLGPDSLALVRNGIIVPLLD